MGVYLIYNELLLNSDIIKQTGIPERGKIMLSVINMSEEHKNEVVKMMQDFYSSPAVFTNGSEEIFQCDVENCINDNPYLEGYIFTEEDIIMGYSMVAKSFSTEFGKPCIWIEDIYLKPEFCGKGIGSFFMSFIENKYPNAVLRLEVEDENERAVHVYEKSGFKVLPYMEMIK